MGQRNIDSLYRITLLYKTGKAFLFQEMLFLNFVEEKGKLWYDVKKGEKIVCLNFGIIMNN